MSAQWWLIGKSSLFRMNLTSFLPSCGDLEGQELLPLCNQCSIHMFWLVGSRKKKRLIFQTGALKKDCYHIWTKKKSNEQLSIGTSHYNHLLNKSSKVRMNATACISVVPAWGSWRQEDQQFKASLGYIGKWGPTWSLRNPVSKGEPKMLEWVSFHTHQSKWKCSVYYLLILSDKSGCIHFRREDHLKVLGRELKSLLLSLLPLPGRPEEVLLSIPYPLNVLHGN